MGATTITTTTLGITTLDITLLIMIELIVPVSRPFFYLNARRIFLCMLSVFGKNVVILNVVAPFQKYDHVKQQKPSVRYIMDKLKLTGQNLGRVLHCRLSRTCIGHAIVHITKQPNLKLKTRPKQLLGSLPLAFALPGYREY